MEAGYTTIDLVMLGIAAFVIWVAMRTPKDKSALKEIRQRAKMRRKGRRSAPVPF
jgi:hypothetical protein